MRQSFKLWTGGIVLVLMVWIISRPCIFHPFSSHTSYDWGFKEATGYWIIDWNTKYKDYPELIVKEP